MPYNYGNYHSFKHANFFAKEHLLLLHLWYGPVRLFSCVVYFVTLLQTGVVANILSKDKNLTPTELKTMLKDKKYSRDNHVLILYN